jgi:hypothetical protein
MTIRAGNINGALQFTANGFLAALSHTPMRSSTMPIACFTQATLERNSPNTWSDSDCLTVDGVRPRLCFQVHRKKT